jgi:hypothetical protein
VIRARATRLAAVASAVVVATTMFAGVASASPPNWSMTVTKLPNAVSPGAPAGYQIDITNNGPSNIPTLFLVDQLSVPNAGETPVYLESSRAGACGPTNPPIGPLNCEWAPLNAGESVQVIVAYDTLTTGTSFTVSFQLNTNGFTFSDSKNRSHGDLLTVAATTALSNNKNFGGFFSTITDTGVGNSDQLSGNNKQSTRIDDLPAGLAGTVQDGSITSDACIPGLGIDCTKLVGETSVVTVGNGGDVNFTITIHFKNVTPTAFVHTFGNPLQQESVNACGATPVRPCFTWDATTSTATILAAHNGSWTGR